MAVAVCLGGAPSVASALALGRVTVQSALGEPLRAEIDIPEANAEELSSLRTAVASPDAFRSAGLEYNAALSSVRITLERRADGRHFLRLSSQRAVTEPFLDVILETSWSSGRIVRDYTMLFDPPSLRQSPPPLAAQVPPSTPRTAAATPPVAAAPMPRVQAARPAAAPVPAAPPVRAPAAAAAADPAPAPQAAASSQPPSADGKQVTVRSGDTASKIAGINKPASVSLDQMLVALLRANPDAFINGNVNRLRSGAVLDIPSSEQAALVPSGQAAQELVVQSRDFNEFRRRLAEGLPTTQVGAADRQASGKVQAQVDDKKPSATAPDKLTLSKGSVASKASEDKIARDRTAQDAATRVAELNKNIADLNRLGTAAPAVGGATSGVTVPLGSATASKPAASAATASNTAAASAPKSVASAASLTASADRSVAAATSAVAASAATPVSAAASAALPAASASSASASMATPMGGSASAALSTASAPAAAAPVTAVPASSTRAAPSPAAPAENNLVDSLLENPIVPATIGGVLALLLGFGFYRARQRKKSTQVDSSFLESRLQPDSFFGASGGQRIDTNEGGATGSSLVYSPSQLDAAGDVDPVAEADVYLAYGRDLQAEEILKEAMRTTPQRVAIHAKLLEIYAKRRDAKAFEQIATEAHSLTRGQGPEWEHICELGQELDASNSLYRAGGQPTDGALLTAGAAAATVGALGSTLVTPSTQATQVLQAMPAMAPATDLDLDLDLDFSLGEDQQPAPVLVQPAAEPTLVLDAPQMPEPMPSLDMDFGSTTAAMDLSPEPVRPDVPNLASDENALNFDLDMPDLPSPATAAQATPASAEPETGMIEFDLSALSLDLDGPDAMASVAEKDTVNAPLSTAAAPLMSPGFADSGHSDPLATKLALAQEFNAIGDPDGARSLAQEVIAEASGDLKSQAQRFLAEIG